MQLSNTRLNQSVIELLAGLQNRTDLPADVVYDLGIAATVMTHTYRVDQSDGEAVRRYAQGSAALLAQMIASPLAANGYVQDQLARALSAAEAVAASSLDGDAAKRGLSSLLGCVDDVFARISLAAPDAATPLFAAFAQSLLSLHESLPLFGELYTGQELGVSAGDPPTAERLSAYFRHALSDPSATVTNLVALPGGFGKETVLFTVTSATLNAELVMRRDPPLDPLAGLDCHSAPAEYPLLKAAFSRGFPAPEPLFFENGSRFLAGPAFTIMRRASGKVAGNAMGGSEAVPAELQATLAQIVARLHDVEPLTELSGNPMFERSLWKRTASDCTRTYISAWHRQFTTTEHSSAPAVQGLFHWLLANVPESDAASTLIHGDIGFHNLLFDDGRLTAVLDWEFGHIGDPAEDLGYIASVMGASLDWPAFLAAYGATGRPVPSADRIRFFEIWSHTRNAAASVMMTGHFEAGRFRSVKFALLAMRYIPHFIAQAETLIARYEEGKSE